MPQLHKHQTLCVTKGHMLQIQKARQIAENELKSNWTIPNVSPVLLDTETIDKPYAWIFFHTSKRSLETGEINYAIGGNAPLFIAKANGQISTFRTGFSLDEMIDNYEEENRIWRLRVTREIYNNAKQLFILKAVLQLTQEKLSNFKANKEIIVDEGAYKRLNKLKLALNEKQVEADVILTALTAHSYAQQ